MKDLPKEARGIVALLQHNGYEAYLVGGCVRDMYLDCTPKDWDVTTNANPEQIQALFPHTFYENEYGTVGVVNDETEDATLKAIEVTPYRKESGYSDKRHPDSVSFGTSLEEDLARRDFTINAFAFDTTTNTLVDVYDGKKDLKDKLIRAVGDAEKRFNEDALRMLRAVRFATEFGFDIEKKTSDAILKHADDLAHISAERIRDEFTKMLLSDSPFRGVRLLHEHKLLSYIVPELEKGIDVGQNQAHSYTVFEHIGRTLQAAADKKFSLELRLATLFHDIAKPHTKAMDTKKNDWSFHGHEVVGSRLARKRMQELRFPTEIVEKVTKLVRWHMFFSDTEQITHSAVRRLIRNVGPENVEDILNVRICDRIGTGRPKEQPYRLRKYKAMIDEVLRDPVSVGMLSIDGKQLMELLGERPGPRIGWILHALLEDVLDDPTQNTKEYLETRAQTLVKLPDAELRILGEKGRDAQEEAEEKEVKKIRSKHHVE
ncbi:MAG: HD domain-containing protein [Candidatus Campbellbacteria bacterium]|nr:HD domain-containing protein [Candidatus Campbellbacteria bacterium]